MHNGAGDFFMNFGFGHGWFGLLFWLVTIVAVIWLVKLLVGKDRND